MPIFVDGGLKPVDGITPPEHEAIDHKGAPFNLLDEIAHDLLDHTGLMGIDAGFKVATTVASGVLTHTFAPGFTPLVGIYFGWSGAVNQQHYTGIFTGTLPAENNTIGQSPFGPVGQQLTFLQSSAGGNWRCTSFLSGNVTVAVTTAVPEFADIVLVVLGT
jgi:hypothetical protein